MLSINTNQLKNQLRLGNLSVVSHRVLVLFEKQIFAKFVNTERFYFWVNYGFNVLKKQGANYKQ